MPPRPRVKIGNVEGRLIIAEQYRQHGALWDIIVNGIKRNPELSSYHTLVTNLKNVTSEQTKSYTTTNLYYCSLQKMYFR